MIILAASAIDDFLERIEAKARQALNEARAKFEEADRALNRASDDLAAVRRHRAKLRKFKATP
jgi:hypothetical protein